MKDFSKEYVNLDITRSSFKFNSSNLASMSQGELVPLKIYEMLPGDTFKGSINALVKLFGKFVNVPAGDLFLDLYTFFVPARLTFDKFEEAWGENKEWEEPLNIKFPTCSFYYNGDYPDFAKDLTYFGFTNLNDTLTNSPNNSVDLNYNMMPILGYLKIYNDFFRDQNHEQPIELTIGSDGKYNLAEDEIYRLIQTVNRYADYFSTCFPTPQKGPSVKTSLGTSAIIKGFAPINTSDSLFEFNNNLKFASHYPVNSGYDYNLAVRGSDSHSEGYNVSTSESGTHNPSFENAIIGSNLFADFDITSGAFADLSSATATTINDLRVAFQLQKFFERLALGGSRYTEVVKSLYGVFTGDARLQRPEYISGHHIPLNVNTVFNTGDSVGLTSSNSITFKGNNFFEYSAVEHGYFYVLGVIRVKHVYSQGMPRFYQKLEALEVYNPLFANLGNQGVFSTEIFETLNELKKSTEERDIFGYQEYAADYRYDINECKGDFCKIDADLVPWSFKDIYESKPILSKDWLKEPKSNILNTLADQKSKLDQFIINYNLDFRAYRPMPMFSIPGLIDHH